MLFYIFLQFHICFSDALTLDESSNNSSFLVFTKPNVYSFILPPGRYKITCYGAQGGWSHCGGSYGNAGGKGAMASGYINVNEKDQMFFAIVGGMGGSSSKGNSAGGYNGGGNGVKNSNVIYVRNKEVMVLVEVEGQQKFVLHQIFFQIE